MIHPGFFMKILLRGRIGWPLPAPSVLGSSTGRRGPAPGASGGETS